MNPRPRDTTGKLIRPTEDYQLRAINGIDKGKWLTSASVVCPRLAGSTCNAHWFPGGHLIALENDYRWTARFEAVLIDYSPAIVTTG